MIKQLKEKNIIFKNLIQKIINNDSPLNTRYKFLNSIEICEILSKSLSKKNKLKNTFYLLNFSIKFIKRDDILNLKNQLQKDKILNILQNLSLELNSNNFNIAPMKGEEYKNNIREYIKNNKKKYMNASFINLKKIYNNYTLKKSDFLEIENSIYSFISTRLSWGFNWKYIKKVFSKIIKAINKNSDEDIIKHLLNFQIKFKRTNYKIYVPIIEIKKNYFFWKNNKLNFSNTNELLESIEEKNEKNIKNLNFETKYLIFEIKSLDPYSAMEEIIYNEIPLKLGATYIHYKIIKINKEKNIFILGNYMKKQFFFYFEYNENLKHELFKNDFHIIPELKYKNILKNIEINNKIQSNIKDFIKLKYNYLEKNLIEDKAPLISTIFEKLLLIFESIGFEKKEINRKITEIAMIDVYIERYVNNAFFIKNNLLEKLKIKNWINDIKYFELYLKEKEIYYISKNNLINQYNKWVHTNEIIKKKNQPLVEASILWFINNGIQARNAHMHEGRKLSFFDRLSIETLDSIISLVITKIINKKIFNIIDFKNLMKKFEKWKLSKNLFNDLFKNIL